MTTMRVMNPEWSVETQACCGAVIEHLNNRDYQRAAELLREAKVVCGQKGDPMAIHVVNAAHRICLACKESQDEAEWHGRVYAEVLEREQGLRQELQTILDLISGPRRADLPQAPEGPSAKQIVETNLPNRCTSHSMERRSLWHRIQNLVQAMNPRRRETSDEKPTITATASFVQTFTADVGAPASKPAAAADPGSVSTPHEAAPSLAVCCLGPFQVYLNDQPVGDWRNGKGKSVFKYLVTHHDRPVSKEILMDLFWPDADPSHARNSLNVTIYYIRQTLSEPLSFSHVLFKDDCYLLNPELDIWVDSEFFSQHIALARAMEHHENLESAIREYCDAEALYGGEFLEEDRFEAWPVSLRQSLQNDYLSLLDRLSRYYFDQQNYDACVTVCNKILAVDACQEDAHRQLMRCYSQQERSSLAMRQYHSCVGALERELEIEPSQSTTELYQRIRNRQAV